MIPLTPLCEALSAALTKPEVVFMATLCRR